MPRTPFHALRPVIGVVFGAGIALGSATVSASAPGDAPEREERAVVLGAPEAPPRPAPPPPANEIDLRRAFAQVARPTARAVVSVSVGGSPAGLGTVVSADGYLLTKASILTAPATVRLPGGLSVPAEVVGVAQEHDVAMLKLTLPPPAQRLALAFVDFSHDAADPPVGKWVATVAPFNAEIPAAGVGVVSVPRRVIQANAVLGVILAENRAGAEAPVGARVAEVVPGGGALRAGVKPGDVIVRIDASEVRVREDVTATLSRARPGQAVDLRLRRGDETVDLTVTLGLRQAATPRTARQNTLGGRLSDRRTGFPAALQHDIVNLRPEEMGGPLVTLDGAVVGLNIARAGRTETYAIPAAVVAGLVQDLRAGKYPATTQPTDPEPAPRARPATRPATRLAATRPAADPSAGPGSTP